MTDNTTINPYGLKTILVTGGAGYVGAVLIPKLLNAGYKVKVLDLYIYGENVLKDVKGNPNLIEKKGDLRIKRNLFIHLWHQLPC